MPQSLTTSERKTLKARAHALDPAVLVGDAGLTPGVLAEIDRSLTAHELIKVRVAGDDRDARLAMRDRVVAELSAASVQVIGKLLVFYRQKPLDPDEPLFRTPAAKKAAGKKGAKPRDPYSRVSTRKAKVDDSPPRTARVRKSGQRSSKKAFQNR
jgi:putative YhbY family RNA-binding protein